MWDGYFFGYTFSRTTGAVFKILLSLYSNLGDKLTLKSQSLIQMVGPTLEWLTILNGEIFVSSQPVLGWKYLELKIFILGIT